MHVEIKLNSFELASYFLNSAKHLTLLESDADLIRIVKDQDVIEEQSNESN